MSIRKNTWDLDGHYDLTKSGQNGYLGAGTLFMWGSNSYGQLGQNNKTPYSSPIQIPGTSWSSIDCDFNATLSTKNDGTLWAWGSNQFGRLGQNDLIRYSSPVQIPGTSWSSVSSDSFSVLATKTD